MYVLGNLIKMLVKLQVKNNVKLAKAKEKDHRFCNSQSCLAVKSQR